MSGSNPVIIEGEIFKIEITTEYEPTPITTPITTKEKLLEIIKLNPTITREELAIALGISINTVKEYILKLKKENRLERTGDNRN